MTNLSCDMFGLSLSMYIIKVLNQFHISNETANVLATGSIEWRNMTCCNVMS